MINHMYRFMIFDIYDGNRQIVMFMIREIVLMILMVRKYFNLPV